MYYIRSQCGTRHSRYTIHIAGGGGVVVASVVSVVCHLSMYICFLSICHVSRSMHVCFVSISRLSICFVSILLGWYMSCEYRPTYMFCEHLSCEYTCMFYDHLSCEQTCICFVCEFLIVWLYNEKKSTAEQKNNDTHESKAMYSDCSFPVFTVQK